MLTADHTADLCTNVVVWSTFGATTSTKWVKSSTKWVKSSTREAQAQTQLPQQNDLNIIVSMTTSSIDVRDTANPT